MHSCERFSWMYSGCLFSFISAFASPQPNPPSWPATVHVYSSSTPLGTIQAEMDTAYQTHGNGTGTAWNGSPPVSGGSNPTPTNNVIQNQTAWADNGQFVNDGVAFLFKPGTYTGLNVYVGYYTSVVGLGTSPASTVIDYISCYEGNGGTGMPVCPPGSGGTANLLTGALNTFWRSAENFTTNPNTAGNVWWPVSNQGMTWAASQACPLRKVNVNGNLYLFQLDAIVNGQVQYASGFSSGGFMADCTITGQDSGNSAVVMGSQQQFCVRNTKAISAGSSPAFSNGVWNQVFIGCTGAPNSNCGNCPGQTNQINCQVTICSGCHPSCQQTGNLGNPYTTIAATPSIAEKPYIVWDGTNEYRLAIPPVETNKVGTSEDTGVTPNYVSFTSVYVATPSDTASSINAQLSSGNHIILTPGVYNNLGGTINVNQQGLVVLGIGFPILVSSSGQACIQVSAQDVRVGGVILQAGSTESPTLLQWGTSATDATGGFLYDCFTRVGRFSGSSSEPLNSTTLMVHIVSNNVVCDNLWLWRADHDTQGLVYNGDNDCKTACQIDGNNVIAYGLAGEHTFNDITIWNGDQGQCYFYQAEFPYDASSGFNSVGYRIGSNVTTHNAWGVGVYSFFRDKDITATSGIGVDSSSQGIVFTNALTRYLAGFGGISSVLNVGNGINPQSGGGSTVNINFPGPAYLCSYSTSSQDVYARSRLR